MNTGSTRRAALLALWVAPLIAPAFGAADDQLLISVDGATLRPPAGTPCGGASRACSGGGGGSLNWLHHFDPDDLVSAGGEYQTIADSHWSFGSLSAAVGGTAGAVKWNLFGEGHRGNVVENGRHAGYQVEALGVATTFLSKITTQLEARQYDIQRTHGNLPKATLSVLPSPHWLLQGSYAYSLGGNLRGTQIASGRLDQFNPVLNWFVGGAVGHAQPTIILPASAAVPGPAVTLAAPRFREGLAGIARTVGRTDWSLLGDYQEVGGTRRVTLTLSCTAHLTAPHAAP